MKFTTETGSEYEISLIDKRMRRLSGTHGPTPNQGEDGAWKVYEFITPAVPVTGQDLLIVWGMDTEAAVVRRTLTSVITSIEV